MRREGNGDIRQDCGHLVASNRTLKAIVVELLIRQQRRHLTSPLADP
jgi:hypothetical protein